MKSSIRNIIIASVAAVTATSYKKNWICIHRTILHRLRFILRRKDINQYWQRYTVAWPQPVTLVLPVHLISRGLDEGSQSPFIRGFFNCEELPTDGPL